MTTNETSFFRDVHPFDALRDTLLPELIERRATERSIKIWSAACSSGQEPYTIAMLIRENFPALAAWRVEILGTDLSTEVLDRAREGRYAQLEVNRGLPAPMLVKYFEHHGASWVVKPDLKRGIDFRPMNLITPWPAMPRFDFVFLRNVLIYFDRATKQPDPREREACAPARRVPVPRRRRDDSQRARRLRAGRSGTRRVLPPATLKSRDSSPQAAGSPTDQR